LFGGVGNYYFELILQHATTVSQNVRDGAGFNNVTFNALGTVNIVGATINIATFAKDATINGLNNSFTKAVFLANATCNDNTTYDTLSLSGNKVYTFAANKTQSFNTIQATSSCTQPVTIQSYIPGTKANISSNLNNITVNYFQI